METLQAVAQVSRPSSIPVLTILVQYFQWKPRGMSVKRQLGPSTQHPHVPSSTLDLPVPAVVSAIKDREPRLLLDFMTHSIRRWPN